jgi:preprotein translocase subunit SecE
MNSIRNTAAAVAAAALLAACSSGPHGSHTPASAPPASTASQSPAAGASGTPGSGASGSPAGTPPGATSAGPLTMKEAGLAYRRIVGPGSTIAGKLSSTASGTAPFSAFRTEALIYARELRAEIGKFQAVRWPARVQSRINTLVTAILPSDIRCLQAQAASGSFTGVQSVSNSNQNCTVADNSPIPTNL